MLNFRAGNLREISMRPLRTTTRLVPYGHVSKVSTFSKVFLPMTSTSTLAMNSS